MGRALTDAREVGRSCRSAVKSPDLLSSGRKKDGSMKNWQKGFDGPRRPTYMDLTAAMYRQRSDAAAIENQALGSLSEKGAAGSVGVSCSLTL
jgi:hypothetical protein